MFEEPTSFLGAIILCLVLSKEWEPGAYYWGLYRDYYRDPFPHSLLSIRESYGQCFQNFVAQKTGMMFPKILDPNTEVRVE